MPYSTSNPPRLCEQDIGNQGPAFWTFTGTDTAAQVRVSGYITNARALGMKAGDVVRYTNTSTTPFSIQTMSVASITAAGAADLTDGTALTVTNTD